MSKEDFKGISSMKEISFVVWWGEIIKRYDITSIDKREIARMAFIVGCNTRVNRRKDND